MFEEDLKEAEGIERRVAKALGSQGFPNAEKVNGYNKGYDIRCGNTLFEVKYDKKAQETGNFFFEYECNGVPSGISSTEADFYIIVYGNVAQMVTTIELREFLRMMWHTYPPYRKENCGDGGRVKGVIIPLEFFTPKYISGMKIFVI